MIAAGLLLLLSGICGLYFFVYRRPTLVMNAGKPVAEPRYLRYLDAWQTVLFDARADTELVRGRVMSLFNVLREQHFSVGTERIWHWGLDGKVEREQIVLRHGRGVVYCQIYEYGSDMYVGWDAHLNVGTWIEKPVASGIDRKTGQRVKLTTVTHAVLNTSEYDLVDLNCLLEWTHAQVTKVLKQYTQERRIDQEIDFKIIRGDRQHTDGSDEKSKSLKGRFLRRKE
jgi:hypothetical protein